MKKRINLQLCAVTAIAIISTLILTSIVYYSLFDTEVKRELKTYADILAFSDFVINQGKYVFEDELRVTIIDSEGTVIYDSQADISVMENHIERPEILNAINDGSGTVVRHSDTVGQNTVYYAMRLDDGRILRVSKEVDNIFAFGKVIIPVVIVIVTVLYGICVIISRMLAYSFVKPLKSLVNEMDKENIRQINTYEELQPLILMIQKQHSDIVKSSKIRQEFTANVSHELKTPLASISGYSELISSGMAKGEEAVRFAGEINKNSKRLLTLINDIIRLSQLDGTELDVEYEDIDLYESAVNVVEMLEFNASKNNISLKLEGDNVCIRANKGMIEELIYNLCDNAIKYNNESGYVKLSVLKKGYHVIFCVKDNGIGISAEDKERIFERFYRVDKSRSKATGGTGLGLAIVKHIVIKHNAKIELDSEKGKGTEIRIIFSGISGISP